ncbi:hypothetical protein PG997_005664 [Apiospora hydei]|uniref:Uncharacterized protein n=1 Tax=Apiospora hydei TaxID=1337664 RepID=A0ABR1WQU3_9PEZI
MIDTAIVVRELGFPSLSPNLIERLLDRRIMQLFCPGSADPVQLVRKEYSSGGEESETALRKVLEAPGFLPEYPIVAKARMAAGHGTEGTYLATNLDDVVLSIKALSVRVFIGEGDLLIDQYEEGPEVDANFVLPDGKLLAFELADRFPTTADQYLPKNEKTKLFGMPRGDFLGTILRWPSKLPQKEKDLIFETVCGVLRSLKATDGVFHAKARIRNSSVHYAPVRPERSESNGGSKDDLVDLVPQPTLPEQDPSVLLLTIKPRPPGLGGVHSGRIAHGVDYQALHLLFALGEKERFRALARPFRFAGGMAPLWVNCVFINVEAGRVYVGGGGDVVLDMIRNRSPLLRSAVYSGWSHGSTGRAFWERRLGEFVVVSNKSDREARENGHVIPWNRPRRARVISEIRTHLLSQPDRDRANNDPAALDREIAARLADAYNTMAYTFVLSPADDALRRRVLDEGRVSANYVSWGVEMIAWAAAFAEEGDGPVETRLRRLGFRTRFKQPPPDRAPWDGDFPAAARACLREEVARSQAGKVPCFLLRCEGDETDENTTAAQESAEAMESADSTPVAQPKEQPADGGQAPDKNTTATHGSAEAMASASPTPVSTQNGNPADSDQGTPATQETALVASVDPTPAIQKTPSMPTPHPLPAPRAPSPASAPLPIRKRKFVEEETAQTFPPSKVAKAEFGNANAKQQQLTKDNPEAEAKEAFDAEDAKAKFKAEARARTSVLVVSTKLSNLINLCRLHGKSWREIDSWTSPIDSMLDEERAKVLDAYQRESGASDW